MRGCNTRNIIGVFGRFLLLILILISTNIRQIKAAAGELEQQVCDTEDDNGGEAGTCSSTTASTTTPRAPPQILANGSFQTLDSSSFEDITSLSHDALLDGTNNDDHDNDNDSDNKLLRPNATIAQIPGGENIALRYVQDLIRPETASRLIESCDKRSGWTSSPQSVGGSATVKATRTSRSCPLIWPQLYLPLMDDPAYKSKLESVRDEIDLTWHLTQRIAQLLDVGEEFIEPFQLVRYQPGEFYKEHHDHGSYYGVDTEQRPLTLLVFLSDVPSSPGVGGEGGGYTKFRAVGDVESGGVAVVPRLGDGVLWKNENEHGELLMDAVHEAIPPRENGGNIIKYAMNVWIAKKKIKDNMDVSAYRTK